MSLSLQTIELSSNTSLLHPMRPVSSPGALLAKFGYVDVFDGIIDTIGVQWIYSLMLTV